MSYDSVMLDILKEIFSWVKKAKTDIIVLLWILKNICHLSNVMLILISVLRHFKIVGNKYKDFSSVS